ncbi:cysteine desulfurase [Chryseolinea serpens]|uniref:cysteine desulfurase n=1 Tax=Chryseolinea serpens TaxID=947013 RepID=A0A1M5QP36_9BACT|nr:family 2A encapsulin nanocompartment cargo protein cysteine desulfurase [Chryseolinea serpens]SHH15887.1 cysteine desulfurase [Chryseolinea serpens]
MNDLHQDNLPDVRELERLANQYFKATPGDPSVESAQRFAQANPVAESQVSDFSPADVGASNTQINHPESFDIKDPQTSLPDPHFYNGEIPKSVAGSGRSPSLQNPSGNYSAEPAGNKSSHRLPFQSEQPFEQELNQVLRQINSFMATPQLPVSPFPGMHPTSFYFLNDNTPSPVPGGIGMVRPPFDINRVKGDFPILKERVNGKSLVWLDNAATTQKPKLVIDRISEFYEHENSNIHRAAHELAARATDAFEGARKKVQRFLNAGSPNEIIFVRGTTEGINLVAQSWGDQNLNAGDEIILSHLEHHANIVPWQLLAEKKGFKIRVIPVDDDGQIRLDEYGKLLNSKTKLVSFTHVSNALGTVTPAQTIINMAHTAGAKVLLDGAQSVSHMRVDVQQLNPDFFVFSGHKIFGPTGIGAVYGKEELLNQMQPWQGGGNMIKDVTFEHTEFHKAPGRFEAGTGNIADAVGLGAAIDYVSRIGMELINQYEHALLLYGTHLLRQVPGLRLIGTAPDKASVMSFVLDGYTNDEVGQALNKEGIAVRTGHHCAQPILRRFGVESTVRPSLAFYNTCADVDALVAVLHKLRSAKRR